jgi:D-aminopeptidase
MRLRDLGVSIGKFPTGPNNTITDVGGVLVGHATLDSGVHGGDDPVLRTGVTAVLPRSGDIFHESVVGGHFILNGAGEMSGLIQVAEWGVIETPILLTNTLSVGAVSAALVQYMVDSIPTIGREHDVIIPLVGECDDSFLNDIQAQHVGVDEVYAAMGAARGGPVAEGGVGAGTGMVTCDLAAGIGTSSRMVVAGGATWTLGVLVLSNFGRLEDLRVDGFPIGRVLASRMGDLKRRRELYGSIVGVIATDAPLSSRQLDRVCKRAALGIGRVGSFAAHGSGEILIGFSTSNVINRDGTGPERLEFIGDRGIDPLYRAAVECTEEAILNALCAAQTVEGVNGHVAPALPLDEVREAWIAQQDIVARMSGGAGRD